MQKFYQRWYTYICFHVITRQVLLAHQWDIIFKDNHFANSFQDFFFVRSTEYALVSQKTVSINLPPKSNKPHHEDYFVGLVITQNPWTDTDRHTLKLNYFILLTSQAELFPSDPVDSKSGEFKAMVLQELSGIYSNHKILTTHAMHDSQPCVRYGRRILLLHILNIHRADKACVKTMYLWHILQTT